jgi:hypothetical protein
MKRAASIGAMLAVVAGVVYALGPIALFLLILAPSAIKAMSRKP